MGRATPISWPTTLRPRAAGSNSRFRDSIKTRRKSSFTISNFGLARRSWHPKSARCGCRTRRTESTNRFGSGTYAVRCLTKQIKVSIKKIGEMIPSLGSRLTTGVRTGYFCSYSPPPERPVAWKFDFSRTDLKAGEWVQCGRFGLGARRRVPRTHSRFLKWALTLF